MNRRFELGPILVALAALVLLVSLFLDWYGSLSAWDAFELVDVLLAALGVMGVIGGLGALVPELGYIERRWLPPLVLVTAVIVAAEIINPPPAAADLTADAGAWIAFAAAIVMLIGAVLSLGRVSLSVSVDRRDGPQRVAAVDERQQTTESGAVVVPDRPAAAPASAAAQSRSATSAPEPTEPTVPEADTPERASRRRKS